MLEIKPNKRFAYFDVLRGTVIFVLIYGSVSMLAYRFRYPELTETQLILRFVDAMLWR